MLIATPGMRFVGRQGVSDHNVHLIAGAAATRLRASSTARSNDVANAFALSPNDSGPLGTVDLRSRVTSVTGGSRVVDEMFEAAVEPAALGHPAPSRHELVGR